MRKHLSSTALETETPQPTVKWHRIFTIQVEQKYLNHLNQIYQILVLMQGNMSNRKGCLKHCSFKLTSLYNKDREKSILPSTGTHCSMCPGI